MKAGIQNPCGQQTTSPYLPGLNQIRCGNPMQKMFFYNTDIRALGGKSNASLLIERGVAITGGDREQFGIQLAKFSPGDLVLMYENKAGIIAVGEVAESWNEKTYQNPIYYVGLDDRREYRIAVEWLHDLTDSPIGLDELRRYIGSKFTPRGATQAINKHRDAIQNCVEDHLDVAMPSPKASDIGTDITVAARRDVVVSRIVRDSKVAQEVKRLNDYRCQLCPTVLRFPDDQLYSEAHHVRPLGGIHKGPDHLSNLISVCPNCHAMLDMGMIKLRTNGITYRSDKHRVQSEFIEYHNSTIYRG